ncbi:M23 family metallopeptidase, partial [Planomicrobium okeanokoites]
KFTVGGRSYEAVYAHLSKIAVSEGQRVIQGQMLGNMGNSGSSTGMHLHFELHSPARISNSNVLNPTMYIPMQ